jgi:hypothetical protein
MGEFLVFKFGNHEIMSSNRGSWLKTANLTDLDKALLLSEVKNSYSFFPVLEKLLLLILEQLWRATFDTVMNIRF